MISRPSVSQDRRAAPRRVLLIEDNQDAREMLLPAPSGYGAPSDATRSVEHGFDHHLVKPVDPDDLARMIQNGAQVS